MIEKILLYVKMIEQFLEECSNEECLFLFLL